MRLTKTIGEIFGDVKIGGTPPREKVEYFGGGIPWVSIKDMGKGKYVSETNETLSESGVQNSNVKLIKKGSLLFSFKLTVGRMCFAGTDVYTNEAIAAFEPNPEIMLEYLYYILPVATKQVKRTNNFGAPLLNKDQIKKLRIPLPPLETQKAIVAKLDQIFAELDQTKSEIQKNLDNTDELWKSALNQAFQGDWEMKKLGEICENFDNQRKPVTAGDRKKGTYPYYGASGIVDYVDNYIYDGDYLLVSEDGANLLARSTPIAFSISGKNWVNNHAHVLKFGNITTQLFVERFLNFIDLSDYVTGSAQPKLNQKNLNDIEIPIPPLSEQVKIVEHLDQVSNEVKALKSQYQSQLDNLEELKKSVLDKAFKGE